MLEILLEDLAGVVLVPDFPLSLRPVGQEGDQPGQQQESDGQKNEPKTKGHRVRLNRVMGRLQFTLDSGAGV